MNIAEILKKCPKDTRLYSTIHGEVKLEEICEGDIHPIICKTIGNKDYRCSFSTMGKYDVDYNGECVLFPSRDQRDWSKFVVPREDLPVGTICVVSDHKDITRVVLRTYVGNGRCLSDTNIEGRIPWRYITPFSKFDPEHPFCNKEDNYGSACD